MHLKNRLMYLFGGHQAKDILNKREISNVFEFLIREVLGEAKIDKHSLLRLVESSEILDIESDATPFSHCADGGNFYI